MVEKYNLEVVYQVIHLYIVDGQRKNYYHQWSTRTNSAIEPIDQERQENKA